MVMNSCNCVPEISTPKIIAPDNYSNALLINAISDREILSAESDEIPLLVKLSYSEPDYHYQKLNAGNSYLRLIDETSKMSLFNLPIELEKFEYYSIVFFGFGNSVKALIFKDILPNNSESKSGLRFINTVFDSDKFIFRLKQNSEQTDYNLSFRSYTDIIQQNTSTCVVEILNTSDGEVLLSQNINVAGGRIYNVILKGTLHTTANKPLTIEIAAADR